MKSISAQDIMPWKHNNYEPWNHENHKAWKPWFSIREVLGLFCNNSIHFLNFQINTLTRYNTGYHSHENRTMKSWKNDITKSMISRNPWYREKMISRKSRFWVCEVSDSFSNSSIHFLKSFQVRRHHEDGWIWISDFSIWKKRRTYRANLRLFKSLKSILLKTEKELSGSD